MDPELRRVVEVLVLPVFSLLGVIITALFTYLGVRSKIKGEKATQKGQDQKTLWERVDQLTDQVALLNMQALEQAAALAEVQGLLKDSQELVADMTHLAEWIAKGAKPPPPPLSWRVRKHLRSLAHRPPETTE